MSTQVRDSETSYEVESVKRFSLISLTNQIVLNASPNDYDDDDQNLW